MAITIFRMEVLLSFGWGEPAVRLWPLGGAHVAFAGLGLGDLRLRRAPVTAICPLRALDRLDDGRRVYGLRAVQRKRAEGYDDNGEDLNGGDHGSPAREDATRRVYQIVNGFAVMGRTTLRM